MFASSRGTPLEHRRIVKVFKWALVRAGLKTTIRLYDCRHTAASLLYAQGVPELQIAAILGHTDPGFTLRTLHARVQHVAARGGREDGCGVGRRAVGWSSVQRFPNAGRRCWRTVRS